nr:hypothetical protein [Aeromicrobium sp. CFBP 8757]
MTGPLWTSTRQRICNAQWEGDQRRSGEAQKEPAENDHQAADRKLITSAPEQDYARGCRDKRDQRACDPTLAEKLDEVVVRGVSSTRFGDDEVLSVYARTPRKAVNPEAKPGSRVLAPIACGDVRSRVSLTTTGDRPREGHLDAIEHPVALAAYIHHKQDDEH